MHDQRPSVSAPYLYFIFPSKTHSVLIADYISVNSLGKEKTKQFVSY